MQHTKLLITFYLFRTSDRGRLGQQWVKRWMLPSWMITLTSYNWEANLAKYSVFFSAVYRRNNIGPKNDPRSTPQLNQTDSFFSQRYEANQTSAVTVMFYAVWRQQSGIINRVKRCWEVKQRQTLSCLIAVLSARRHCPWALCLIFQPETQRDSVERPTLRYHSSILQLVRSKVKVTRGSAIAERPRCRVRYSFRQT